MFAPFEGEGGVLKAFAALRLGLDLLARYRDRPPHDPRGWEQLMMSSLGWLDYILAMLPDRARAGGVELASVVPWDDYVSEARALATTVDDRFAQFMDSAGKPGPNLGQLLTGRDIPGGELWLWADCMRWDLLNFVLFRTGDSGRPWHPAGGGFTWAQRPTVTSLQVEGVASALREAPDFHPADPRGPFLPSPAFHRVDLVDDKVHTCRDDYATFLDECLLSWKRKVEPFLAALAAEELTRILIVSDHGYRINHSFQVQQKLEQPRYLHGEGTLQEVLCPWVELRLR